MFGPTSPAYSIGRTQRSKDKITQLPGPGNYNVTGELSGKMASFSRQMRNSQRTEDLPGPGSYNYKDTTISGPRAVMTSSPHTQRKGGNKDSQKSPGPGAYNPLKPSHSTSYSISGKANVQSEQGTRGQYYYKQMSSSQGPGPGAYEGKFQEDKKGAVQLLFRFGTSRRKIELTSDPSVPGPGAYKTFSNTMETPKYSLGRAQRQINSTRQSVDGPGPGNYNIGPSKREAPSAIIFERRPQTARVREGLPGPGAYENVTQQTTVPSFSIGRSQRLNVKLNEGPSAQQYNPRKLIQAVPAYTIGKNQRWNSKSAERNQMPGPGAYDGKYQNMENSPNYSIRGRTVKVRHEDVPGPGAYTPKSSSVKSTPRAIFGTTKRKQLLNNTYNSPAPWDYDVNLTNRIGVLSFTRAKRTTKDRNSNPGPGSYNIPNTVGNQSVRRDQYSRQNFQPLPI